MMGRMQVVKRMMREDYGLVRVKAHSAERARRARDVAYARELAALSSALMTFVAAARAGARAVSGHAWPGKVAARRCVLAVSGGATEEVLSIIQAHGAPKIVEFQKD